jgi:sugar phosphate permease
MFELRYRIGGRRAWVVWAAAVSIYVLAVFYRTSLAVAGLTAAQRFDISAAQLATFTMVQLLVYAGMQIPVGVLLDRVGSKRMLAIGLTLMTIGQLAFAFADTFVLGLATRILVGIGDSMIFVSVLRLVMLWFPPARSPIITQLTGLLGQVGTIAAAVPMAHALSKYGWTPVFVGASVIGVLLGVVLYLVVIDTPFKVTSARPPGLTEVADNVREAWAQPGTRLGLWTHFTTQFSVTAMGLLWGYPYFVQGEGVSQTNAGLLLTIMTISSMVSGPLLGAAVARHPFNRSTIILSIVFAIVLAWTVVLMWPGDAPLLLLVVLVLIVGVGGPSSMVGFDFARTFNPVSRLGSATGIVNIGGFVASLTTILGIGLVLDVLTPGGSTDYSHDTFRWAMAFQYLIWGFGALQIWRYRRRTRRALLRDNPAAYGALKDGDMNRLVSVVS